MSTDLELKHTDDFKLDMTLTDDDGSVTTGLTGSVSVLQIKDKLINGSVLVTTTALLNTTNGTIQFTVTDTLMAALLPTGDMRRALIYGVQITYSDGIDEQLLSGRINLTRGVID